MVKLALLVPVEAKPGKERICDAGELLAEPTSIERVNVLAAKLTK
jgi:hypothetical protein